MRRRSIDAEFWSKVEPLPSGCWLWKGCRQSRGYGYLNFQREQYLAHRLAYQFEYGSIPDGSVIDHLCSKRLCVNPTHLQAISNGLNIGRGTSGKFRLGNNRFRNVWPRGRSIHSGWRVRVKKDGRSIHGGSFVDEEVAAMQANVLAARLFPGFRAFNKVEMG